MDEESRQIQAQLFVERARKRQRAFDFFSQSFAADEYGLMTTVTNPEGRTDTITIDVLPRAPQIVALHLDEEQPVRFAPTMFSVHFRRIKPYVETPVIEAPKSTIDSIFFDFEDDPEAGDEQEISEDSRERILEDLEKKFADLGFPQMPIAPYALRLLRESVRVKKRVAYAQAETIIPLYRSLETKRLLADPTLAESDYNAIAHRRQLVYTQLIDLLRVVGKSPAQITEYMMKGLFDSDHIAGVPIFIGEDNCRYIVIDYAYSGYDEQNPVGTDFSGSLNDRSSSNILEILQRAEEKGYATCFYNKFLSGGTHQQWNWHGIRIDGYEKDNLEGTVDKVLKILRDVGIQPEESINTNEGVNLADGYMRNV